MDYWKDMEQSSKRIAKLYHDVTDNLMLQNNNIFMTPHNSTDIRHKIVEYGTSDIQQIEKVDKLIQERESLAYQRGVDDEQKRWLTASQKLNEQAKSPNQLK